MLSQLKDKVYVVSAEGQQCYLLVGQPFCCTCIHCMSVVHVCRCMYIRTYIVRLLYTCVGVCTYVRTYIVRLLYTCVGVCTYVRTLYICCTRVYVYVHTYVHCMSAVHVCRCMYIRTLYICCTQGQTHM